ncbi:hypothetical protein CKAH01_09833 [Colletotrichum kahawae]|uniref:Uncharacterized protein n=1 Tax=Colletotrichum kahawae TaxID=34407 RepID=A0AAD9XYS8_COLKA|nr:hypothetical protein CKAH01_09833 [Colletotrichum kahawae]
MAPPSSGKFLGWGEAALAAAAADTGVRVPTAPVHTSHTPDMAKSGCSFHRHHGGTGILSRNDSNDRRGNSQRSAAYSGCGAGRGLRAKDAAVWPATVALRRR